MASGHESATSRPVLVSGVSPLSGCSVDPDPPPLFDGPDHDLELEPALAVDPRNPDNVVAAWLQGENLGVVAASSDDGGKTWRRAVVPGITTCTGGMHDIAFNPSLSFGPDGTVYLAVMASGGYFPDPRGALTRVMVSRSTDGGRSWDTTAVTGSDAANDFPTVAAEPDEPGAAVVVWAKKTIPASDTTMFSRTTDGGRTWSIPRIAATTAPDRLALNHIVALGDGSLVIARSDFPLSGATSSGSELRLFRSTDKGETWEPGARVSGVRDKTLATEGARTLHIVATIPSGDGAAVNVYTSDDGGLSLAPPRTAATVPTDGTVPSVAADDEHNLAVALRDGFPDGRLLLLHEHDRSGVFHATEIGADTSLPAEGAFYMSPTATGLDAGFAVAAAFGSPQAVHGPTDIFFSRLRAPHAGGP